MGIRLCKKQKELIKLGDETSDIPEKEKDMKAKAEDAKRTINNAKEKAKDMVENAMNHLAPVKQRTIARRNQLEEAMEWKRKKEIIMGQVEWKDIPPRELIGKLTMTITGGIGKIRYVRFLKDPETGQALKQASKDGTEIGGNIISHYVEEIIAPGQKIARASVPVKGCPSAEEAKENMMAARAAERKRIKKARGLE